MATEYANTVAFWQRSNLIIVGGRGAKAQLLNGTRPSLAERRHKRASSPTTLQAALEIAEWC